MLPVYQHPLLVAGCAALAVPTALLPLDHRALPLARRYREYGAFGISVFLRKAYLPQLRSDRAPIRPKRTERPDRSRRVYVGFWIDGISSSCFRGHLVDTFTANKFAKAIRRGELAHSDTDTTNTNPSEGNV